MKLTLLCKTCNRTYIYKGYRKSAASKIRCSACYVNKGRLRLKQKMVSYLGGSCHHCGYKKSIHSLEFHHLEPKLKEFNLSGAHCRSWKAIEEELNKCILLCSNCHREEEYGIVSLAPVDPVDPVSLIS